MSATTKHETQINADPAVPTIEIIREFDAPRAHVWRAFTERDLVERWLGPRNVTMTIERWECRTGGGYRYSAGRDGEDFTGFYGSFHEVRPEERIVQTFTWVGMPDGVSLETATFEELEVGRTRVRMLSVVDSMEARDGILSSGMDVGVKEGFEQLDELLGEL